jgi:hypothetical protein
MPKLMCGLVASGQIRRNSILRFLPERLGPIKTSSYRLASRMANILKAGYPAKDWTDLDGCRIVILRVPEAALERTVAQMASADFNWRAKSVMLLDSVHSSKVLAPLAAAGARTVSVNAVAGFEDTWFVVEGAQQAVRDSRRLLERGNVRISELRASKELWWAALSLAGDAVGPIASASTGCMKKLGLHPGESAALIERTVVRGLRAALRSGAKTRSAFPAEGAADVKALSDADPEFTRIYCNVAQVTGALTPRRR